MYYTNGLAVGNIHLLFVLSIFALLCKSITEEENTNILPTPDKTPINIYSYNIYHYTTLYLLYLCLCLSQNVWG